MKLLLTSAGFSNPTIIAAMQKLMGKSLQGVKLAFIPTAANVEPGEKNWLTEDYQNCLKAGFSVDIVDISTVDQAIWQPRLEAAEVLFFGGGNTFHLMHWMQQSGLVGLLPKLLERRIYVGLSAGSCIAGPTIYNSVQNLFDETYELVIKEGLGLVNFQIVPHLNSPEFKKIKEDKLVEAAKEISEPVYALDDNSALVVDGGKVEVVSEGKWLLLD